MSGIEITGDVNAFLKFLTAGSTLPILEREIRRGTIKASLFLITKVKEGIKGRRFTPNSPLTLALSRGDIPLLKEKNLFDALGFALKNSFESEVGVMKGRKTTGGVASPPHDMQKVALLLHEGYTIDVTPQVRAAIIHALRERGGRKAKSALRAFDQNTGQGKAKFRVRPRKFLSSVFKNPSNQEKVKRIWREALETAFQKAGAKDGDQRDR